MVIIHVTMDIVWPKMQLIFVICWKSRSVMSSYSVRTALVYFYTLICSVKPSHWSQGDRSAYNAALQTVSRTLELVPHMSCIWLFRLYDVFLWPYRQQFGSVLSLCSSVGMFSCNIFYSLQWYQFCFTLWRQCACVHFPSAICDHKQELLDTVAKHRFV